MKIVNMGNQNHIMWNSIIKKHRKTILAIRC